MPRPGSPAKVASARRPETMKRIPRTDTASCRRISTPRLRSAATPFGVTPSPPALSIGRGAPSATMTSSPCSRAAMLAASPAGPPPTMKTSVVRRGPSALTIGGGASARSGSRRSPPSSARSFHAQARLGPHGDGDHGRHLEEKHARIAQSPRHVGHVEDGLRRHAVAGQRGAHGHVERVLAAVEDHDAGEHEIRSPRRGERPLHAVRPEDSKGIAFRLEHAPVHLPVAQAVAGPAAPDVDGELPGSGARLGIEADLAERERHRALDVVAGRLDDEGHARLGCLQDEHLLLGRRGERPHGRRDAQEDPRPSGHGSPSIHRRLGVAHASSTAATLSARHESDVNAERNVPERRSTGRTEGYNRRVRLLVIEDEHRLAQRLARGLREEGFAVDTAFTTMEARDRVIDAAYDLILLDLRLPDGSGLDLLVEWRGEGLTAPVLLLTAKDLLEDKVRGLDAGADDYLTKPFYLEELLARVRALLRRRTAMPRDVLEIDDLRLDRTAHRVDRAGRTLTLTAKEFALLEFLMLHAGQALSRSTIAEHVWDAGYDAQSNVIDVIMGRLRRKIDEGREARLIQTVQGVGYVLQPVARQP